MVATIKFSGFANGGNLANGYTTVGLGGGTNEQFNNPWTFLPSGSTGTRPAITADIYYRLRLNTTLQSYEYYDPVASIWRQIATTTDVFTWNVVTTSPFQMIPDNGYITNSAGLISLVLPVTALVGQEIAITGQGTGMWRIIQGNNQLIHIGDMVSTTGSSGSITATNQYDSLKLVCITDNLEWTTVGGPQGNLTIV